MAGSASDAVDSGQTGSAVFTTYNISRIMAFAGFAVVLTLANLFLTSRLMDIRAPLSTRPEIVTINAGDMLLGFVARSAPDVDEAELQRRARALNRELESAVTQLAAENNWIVVNAGSVLAGPRDITALVLDRLAQSAAFGGSP